MATEDSRKKDVWEKLSAVAGLFSGGLIALVGLWATHTYNDRQLEILQNEKNRQWKILQLETLDKMKSSLNSEEESERTFAYFVFVNLGYEDLAVDLIGAQKDAAGKDVLVRLTKSEDEGVRKSANKTLQDLALETKKEASTYGQIRAQLTFRNDTDLPLRFNWVDHNGTEFTGPDQLQDPNSFDIAGTAQSGNVYQVRIEHPKCEPLKQIPVTRFEVRDAGSQTLLVTPEMITSEMRERWESSAGC